MNRASGNNERMNFVAGGLFLMADVFAVISAALPEWIISETRSSVSGASRFGLLRFCVQIAGRDDTECYTAPVDVHWLITFMCICLGSVFALMTSIVLILSVSDHWRLAGVFSNCARWTGLCSLVMFCVAAVLVPAGFGRVEIGGAAYKLPRNCRIGTSYIFFILALWTVVVSELLAGRFCTLRL